MLWILTHLKMSDLHAFNNQPIKIKRIGFFIYQAIDVYVSYLCCEYQLTLVEWYFGGLASDNQIQAHVHACAGMHFSVYQSIDAYIIYISC
jgi:hypothetical protein